MIRNLVFLCLATAWTLVVFSAPAPAQTSASPARQCVMDHWARFLAPAPQKLEKIETIHSDQGDILAFRLSPFTGDYAKLYVMMLDNTECFSKAAVVGSYAMTQNFHAEKQQAAGKKVTRLFHIDLYDGDQHTTIGFREGDIPSYKSMRPLMLKALK